MGIHPANWRQDQDGSFSAMSSLRISEHAKTNRYHMSQVLETVGFVNYPTEYWHWSYGERYWAYHKKQPYAIYGAVNETELA